MAFPFSHLPPQYTDGEALNAAKRDARVTAQLNLLVDAMQAMGQGLIDDANGSTAVTMTTASQFYALGSAAVTWTVPAGGRRYRIAVNVAVAPASATAAHYFAHAAYSVGSSAGTIVLLAAAASPLSTASTATQNVGNEGTVSLAPGTYTAFPAVERTSGSATDQISSGYVAIYDVGAV